MKAVANDELARFRLPGSLLEAARRQAEAENRSLSDMLRDCIRQRIEAGPDD